MVHADTCNDPERHRLLHQHLDELVACMITTTGRRPSEVTVLELLQWSAERQRC